MRPQGGKTDPCLITAASQIAQHAQKLTVHTKADCAHCFQCTHQLHGCTDRREAPADLQSLYVSPLLAAGMLQQQENVTAGTTRKVCLPGSL